MNRPTGGVDDFLRVWGETPTEEGQDMAEHIPPSEYRISTKRKAADQCFFINHPAIKSRTSVNYAHFSGATLDQTNTDEPQHLILVTSWCIITLTGQHLEELQQNLSTQSVGDIWCYDAKTWRDAPKQDAAVITDTQIVIPMLPNT